LASLLAAIGGVLLCWPTIPRAQDFSLPGAERRPGDVRPELPEFLPPPGEALPGGGLQLPPLPAEPAPREALPPVQRGPTIVLNGFRFEGSTVFSDAELAAVTVPYVGRPVTAEDLEEARNRLTLLYVQNGYANSGAILPDQEVTGGILTMQIVEGVLTGINIEGHERLDPDYIRSRLALGAGPPLNVRNLEERFRLLLQDPLIERLNGTLGPGVRPGGAVLDLNVTRARPYSLTFGIDNHRPPSIGALTGRANAVIRNLTGWGDAFDVDYGRSDGATEFEAGGRIPISPRDTTLHLRGRAGNNVVVEEPLSELDIAGRFWSVEGGIRSPVYRTPQQEFALDLTLARRHSGTTLLGRPFSFSPGTRDGEADVTVLRFAQEWTDRSPVHVLAARSTFSLGLGVLGATRNAEAPDSQYLAWLGQAQWARRLTETDVQIILRADVQLANDALLPLEQFAVGGANSVRGYRENEFVRDNGLVASVEGRIPLFDLTLPGAPPGYRGRVILAPFVDYGNSWNKDQTYGQGEDLASIGIGLRWSPWPWLEATLYSGYGLRDLNRGGDNLQDKGIHFSIVARPFNH
jgi:hemolysin activation/secretion protein